MRSALVHVLRCRGKRLCSGVHSLAASEADPMRPCRCSVRGSTTSLRLHVSKAHEPLVRWPLHSSSDKPTQDQCSTSRCQPTLNALSFASGSRLSFLCLLQPMLRMLRCRNCGGRVHRRGICIWKPAKRFSPMLSYARISTESRLIFTPGLVAPPTSNLGAYAWYALTLGS